MSTRDSDKDKPLKQDGYSKEGEATATCYCGAVQLAFPTTAPGLVDTFVCHCTDCRKITASAFTSAFIVAASAVKHIRGQDNLKKFSQSQTTASGQAMTNCFCDTCTVDDLNLMEGLLRPKREVYVKDRVSWVHGVEGARQSEIME
ncbi:uncharacterized protein J4E79_004419 [Alternaria viburni]|uniref:uncharacterized protein n=1 Tax=Alternaria viburni TaxID=566460 RepID=UPI0020C48C0E|nr:uncharacterized protein J4E79_004419 [Alternaria viburni]KAI4663105.1 hypothetical protein J4E79_004419 [Alternaria viburni]